MDVGLLSSKQKSTYVVTCANNNIATNYIKTKISQKSSKATLVAMMW